MPSRVAAIKRDATSATLLEDRTNPTFFGLAEGWVMKAEADKAPRLKARAHRLKIILMKYCKNLNNVSLEGELSSVFILFCRLADDGAYENLAVDDR
jgi:hypothetical protein